MRVAVGRIGKPHGIRGEVTIEPRTDDPHARFAVGATLLTEQGALTVESVRFHHDTPLVQFAGIADRTAAEAVRNTLLYVDTDEGLPPTEDDEYWDHELEGMRVTAADGEHLGEVREVLHLPGQDVLAVVTPAGSEVLVPFVRDIVTVVDRHSRTVVIHDPGGLFDEGLVV